ncbi:MAG TPA: NTP transferase domain-containing protein [Arsenophonus apicola]|uniref:NTP transferase domain-containing protein n=1 Tax=Arsenophonus apicola TaxID=2879119 RepID=UPI00387A6506
MNRSAIPLTQLTKKPAQISKTIDCIIPAAGLSSRMGQWKMMLPWQHGTILDASIKNALAFCSHIILVIGYRAEELMARYQQHPAISLIYHADYQQGLFSSIRAGAQAVNSDYCFITHGDMPCLTNTIFQQIWCQRGAYALIPRYQKTPGHPVLLSRHCLNRAVRQTDCRSMQQAVRKGQWQYIDLNQPAIIADIDTPEIYLELRTIENLAGSV